MTTTNFTLVQIEDLCRRVFRDNGCDQENTESLVRTVVSAERDGSASHGLFRVPGYVASLRSGKVNGHAKPQLSNKTPVILDVDGDRGFAPLALEKGISALSSAAREYGIAAMTIRQTHHFAALWPEVELLAEQGLVGLACVNSLPVVAPHGGKEPLFGTNPMAFAWPRPGKAPMVFDMASSAMAQGEVQIAARDGLTVPAGTGLDAEGLPSNNPAEILQGVLLPFGGHKGSAIALMVELLAAGATGDNFSSEAKAVDNGDGGPAIGGEFLLAISPELTAGPDWIDHCEAFFTRFEQLDGPRLPGLRRHQIRKSGGSRAVNKALVDKIQALCR